MSETPRDYDREFTVAVTNRARRRLRFDTERGAVVRFVVQLEYFYDGDWQAVVRYDHDGTGENAFAHDVTEEGLHIDIFRDGSRAATEYVSPPQSAAVALDRAEDHLSKNLERFLDRYERWHGITNR